jgi:hypothetical protein
MSNGGTGLAALAADGNAVYAKNFGPGGFKASILGEAINTNHAIEGRQLATGATGVLGGSLFGMNSGVYGKATNNGGDRGVWGEGAAYGVYGTGLTGVAGVVTATGQIALSGEVSGTAGALALHTVGNAVMDSNMGFPSAGIQMSNASNGYVLQVDGSNSVGLKALGGPAITASTAFGSQTAIQATAGGGASVGLNASADIAVLAQGTSAALSATASGGTGVGVYAAGQGAALSLNGQVKAGYASITDTAGGGSTSFGSFNKPNGQIIFNVSKSMNSYTVVDSFATDRSIILFSFIASGASGTGAWASVPAGGGSFVIRFNGSQNFNAGDALNFMIITQ